MDTGGHAAKCRGAWVFRGSARRAPAGQEGEGEGEEEERAERGVGDGRGGGASRAAGDAARLVGIADVAGAVLVGVVLIGIGDVRAVVVAVAQAVAVVVVVGGVERVGADRRLVAVEGAAAVA